MGSPGIPHGIVPRRGGAEQGVPLPTSVRRRLVPPPGPAEVCQLRCSGRGEQSGPAAPPARGSRGVLRALRVRRAGELPQGHCPAQCSEAASSSILPSGPCYDELVAPLYSYSIGASSRYNIFYSASFARLHSEFPRGNGAQAGQGRWAGGVPGQVLPLAGLRGPVRGCGGTEQAAAAQSGAEPLSCSPRRHQRVVPRPPGQAALAPDRPDAKAPDQCSGHAGNLQHLRLAYTLHCALWRPPYELETLLPAGQQLGRREPGIPWGGGGLLGGIESPVLEQGVDSDPSSPDILWERE